MEVKLLLPRRLQRHQAELWKVATSPGQGRLYNVHHSSLGVRARAGRSTDQLAQKRLRSVARAERADPARDQHHAYRHQQQDRRSQRDCEQGFFILRAELLFFCFFLFTIYNFRTTIQTIIKWTMYEVARLNKRVCTTYWHKAHV